MLDRRIQHGKLLALGVVIATLALAARFDPPWIALTIALFLVLYFYKGYEHGRVVLAAVLLVLAGARLWVGIRSGAGGLAETTLTSVAALAIAAVAGGSGRIGAFLDYQRAVRGQETGQFIVALWIVVLAVVTVVVWLGVVSGV